MTRYLYCIQVEGSLVSRYLYCLRVETVRAHILHTHTCILLHLVANWLLSSLSGSTSVSQKWQGELCDAAAHQSPANHLPLLFSELGAANFACRRLMSQLVVCVCCEWSERCGNCRSRNRIHSQWLQSEWL